MKSIVFLSFFLTTLLAHANMDFYFTGPLKINHTLQSEACPETTSVEKIKTLINNIIQKDFPELIPAHSENRIQIREFESNDYFLKTFFKLGHILKKKRIYFLDINTKIYTCAPEEKALEAILMHEIQHIKDYKDATSAGLVKLGIKMLGKKSRSQYERSTDFSIMELGHAEGIKAYRNWIYQQLDQKSLRKKQCYYYTPEEINRYLKGELDFKDYFSKYCK